MPHSVHLCVATVRRSCRQPRTSRGFLEAPIAARGFNQSENIHAFFSPMTLLTRPIVLRPAGCCGVPVSLPAATVMAISPAGSAPQKKSATQATPKGRFSCAFDLQDRSLHDKARRYRVSKCCARASDPLFFGHFPNDNAAYVRFLSAAAGRLRGRMSESRHREQANACRCSLSRQPVPHALGKHTGAVWSDVRSEEQ